MIDLKEIRNRRRRMLLTQDDMAVKLGISPSSYCKLETGSVSWRIEQAKKVKEILKLKDKEFIKIFLN